MRVLYDDMEFVWISSHYDIHLAGLCRLNGKLCKFVTIDETDYAAMSASCPYCSDEENKDSDTCTCSSYTDLECEIIPLSLSENIRWFLQRTLFEYCVGKHWSYRNNKRQSHHNMKHRPKMQALYYTLHLNKLF